MQGSVTTVRLDPERTRSEDDGPATPRVTSLLGRGSVLAGKYRLELLLGEGGMGFVWSAYNLELELPVAIKLLRTGPRNQRLADRLRLEARAAARLVHPAIVRIFDIAATESGDPFIVMELLSGESLADLLCRGRLSSVRAVQLLLPIAEALALAHARGIVHRDLKPDNVFLASDGEQLQPKLLDFGIAKLEYATTSVNKLTEKGTVLGSPNYMSPEQVRGEDVDYRTDIWSFCVLLFKAITGITPFRGPNKLAVMDSIMTNEPAALPPDAGIDHQLARLVLWGLSKDAQQRPSSMRELGRQLAQWLLNRGISDDAAGAPLAAKWLAHVAEPSMRRPPVLADAQQAEPPRPPSHPPEKAQILPALTAAPRRLHSREQRSVLARHRPWALLAAASLLVVGASAALTESEPHAGTGKLAAVTLPGPDLEPARAPLSSTSSPAEPAVASLRQAEAAGTAVQGGAEPTAATAEPAPVPPRAPRLKRTRPAPQLPF